LRGLSATAELLVDTNFRTLGPRGTPLRGL